VAQITHAGRYRLALALNRATLMLDAADADAQLGELLAQLLFANQ
jgi:hypothetical protein